MKLWVRLLIALAMGVIFQFLFWLGLTASLEEWTTDLRLRHRPERPASDKICLVGIGDDDVGSPELGRWPFPRVAHADVLAIVEALGAAHCSFDILFTESSGDTDEDTALIKAIEASNQVTLAYYFHSLSGDTGGRDNTHFLPGKRYGMDVASSDFLDGAGPIPPFSTIDTSYGAVNVKSDDNDGVIRRVPLFIAHENHLYPAFALQTVIDYLGADPDQIDIEPGKHVTLVGTSLGKVRIPVDAQLRYRVNFPGGTDSFGESFQYLDLYSAVQDADLGRKIAGRVKDRIVLVGNVSTGNSDIVNTPMGLLPGLTVHAAVVSNILEGKHLRFPSPLLSLGFTLIFALVTAFILRGSPRFSVPLFFLWTGLWVYLGIFAAGHDWILPLTPPLLAGLGCFAVILPSQVERVSHYIPPAIRKALLGDSHRGGSQRREVTVFFADIRGFTAWTQEKEADEVTEVLNEYLAAMTEIVDRHKGTLDKFIGDCLMVFFGAPQPRKDHAIAALRMARDMQLRMEDLASEWSKRGRTPLHVGIGLNSDWVTAGNFGSRRYHDYTVIGRGVNLAARIESLAPGKTILISERTKAMAPEGVTTELFAELILKGISDPVPVYEVIEVEGIPCQANRETTGEAWWLMEEGKETGPYPLAGIEVMLQCDRINSNSTLKRAGSEESVRVGQLFT